MEPVACWHHGDLARLEYHLHKGRIDLYGPNEFSPKRKNKSRQQRFLDKMCLKKGDKIRIVIKGKIVYTAIIVDGIARDLPNEWCNEWGSAVYLKEIEENKPPLPADCFHHYQGSHRLVQKSCR